MRDILANMMKLGHRRAGWTVFMFPDVSELLGGSALTDKPAAHVYGGMAVCDLDHDPSGVLSDALKGSQLRWATIGKKTFAIISTFRRLEYLLWDEVNIYSTATIGTCIFSAASDNPPFKAIAHHGFHWQRFSPCSCIGFSPSLRPTTCGVICCRGGG